MASSQVSKDGICSLSFACDVRSVMEFIWVGWTRRVGQIIGIVQFRASSKHKSRFLGRLSPPYWRRFSCVCAISTILAHFVFILDISSELERSQVWCRSLAIPTTPSPSSAHAVNAYLAMSSALTSFVEISSTIAFSHGTH